MSNFVAVLDTNVLFGFTVRNLLLTMANPQRLYTPYWSNQIMAELDHALRRERPNVDFRDVYEHMNDMLPDAARNPPRQLIDAMTNHPKDRHVLALAVMVNAQVIVTDNSRDFGPEHCTKFGIQAVTADAFIVNQIHLYEGEVVEAFHMVANALARKRPMTPSQLIGIIRPQLPQAMTELTRLMDARDL